MFSLILTGDVMLGRGVDQIQRHRCDPAVPDPRVHSALDFVRAAEGRNGPIPRDVDPSYVWGEALDALEPFGPSLRIVNLETAITTAPTPAPKPITYRMHPGNVGILSAFGADCCALANNHVLDWGEDGLRETLDTLDASPVRRVGAGRDLEDAWRAVRLPRPDGGHVVVVSVADATSGVPADWAAHTDAPGVAFLDGRIGSRVARVADAIGKVRGDGDIAVASIHWGSNWGYDIGRDQIEFARRLIDEAGVDVIHGHSSHHPRQIAAYRGRPVLFGCGDIVNDYEGIQGQKNVAPRVVAVYALVFDGNTVRDLRILPFRLRRFRLERAAAEDAAKLAATVSSHSRQFAVAWSALADGSYRLVKAG